MEKGVGSGAAKHQITLDLEESLAVALEDAGWLRDPQRLITSLLTTLYYLPALRKALISPLSSASRLSKLAAEQPGRIPPEELSSLMKSLHNWHSRAEEVTRDCFAFTDLLREPVDQSFTTINLGELCGEVVDSASDKDGVPIEMRRLPDSVHVLGSEHHLRHAIRGILAHGKRAAADYADGPCRIVVSIMVDAPYVQVEVQNQHPAPYGYREEDLAWTDIFSPFGNSYTALSLTVARDIIQAHEGTIGIKSDANVGFTIFFRLPLGQP